MVEICSPVLCRSEDETLGRQMNLRVDNSPWWLGEDETRQWPDENGCGIGEFIIEL